jgi:hypothetical protein
MGHLVGVRLGGRGERAVDAERPAAAVLTLVVGEGDDPLDQGGDVVAEASR